MSISILLVDDHELVRQGFNAMLEKHDDISVVGEAATGTEGIEKAFSLKPDVVVLDIALPDLDGIAVAHRIHAAEPGIKILALSMHAERRFVSEMFAAGASGYILKASVLEELLNAIHTVSRGKRYLSPELVDLLLEDFIGDEAPSVSPAFARVTPREREVLQLISAGKTTKEIAQMLDLSVKTVETHRQQLLRKLDCGNVVELTRLAIREGLVEP